MVLTSLDYLNNSTRAPLRRRKTAAPKTEKKATELKCGAVRDSALPPLEYNPIATVTMHDLKHQA